MLSLKDEAEIYLIGLVTGLFTKNDVISWADKIIEIEEIIEYEIIEISLLGMSSKADIALKLSEFKGVPDNHKVINSFLGLCSYFYKNKKFTAEDMCTTLYRLVSTKVDMPICSDIEQKIHYLSDGYYLASEGIDGDLESICSDLNVFLEQYIIYAKNLVFDEHFSFVINETNI